MIGHGKAACGWRPGPRPGAGGFPLPPGSPLISSVPRSISANSTWADGWQTLPIRAVVAPVSRRGHPPWTSPPARPASARFFASDSTICPVEVSRPVSRTRVWFRHAAPAAAWLSSCSKCPAQPRECRTRSAPSAGPAACHRFQLPWQNRAPCAGPRYRVFAPCPTSADGSGPAIRPFRNPRPCSAPAAGRPCAHLCPEDRMIFGSPLADVVQQQRHIQNLAVDALPSGCDEATGSSRPIRHAQSAPGSRCIGSYAHPPCSCDTC